MEGGRADLQRPQVRVRPLAPACPPARVPFLAESRPPSPVLSPGDRLYLCRRGQRTDGGRGRSLRWRPADRQASASPRAGEARVPLGLTLPTQRHFGLLHSPCCPRPRVRVRPPTGRPPAHPSIYPCVLSSPKRLRARSLGGSVTARTSEDCPAAATAEGPTRTQARRFRWRRRQRRRCRGRSRRKKKAPLIVQE